MTGRCHCRAEITPANHVVECPTCLSPACGACNPAGTDAGCFECRRDRAQRLAAMREVQRLSRLRLSRRRREREAVRAVA
jgi:hypothetical protein